MTTDAKKWFIAFSDHYEGPFTGAEVREKVSQKKVDANPFIWCEGMNEWIKMSETPLAMPASVAPPSLPPARQVAAAASSTSYGELTATPVTVVTKETVVTSPSKSSSTRTISKITAPPPAGGGGGHTPAGGTLRPKKDVNDLSGFIDVSPKNADDRTEFIDKEVLKSAKKEAAHIIRENKITSQPEGRKPWRLIFISLILFILLGLALIYGNILS